jgi:hypothetical protein
MHSSEVGLVACQGFDRTEGKDRSKERATTCVKTPRQNPKSPHERVFLMKLLGWYSLTILVLETLLFIANENGTTASTGGERVLGVVFMAPIIYYVARTLFTSAAKE